MTSELSTPIQFRILGPVEVSADGRELDMGHARQRAVLAVLLLDLNRVVPDGQLIDRIWGEDPPASVRSVIYGYMARLRTALSAAQSPGVALVRRSGGYVLTADPDQLDLQRFRDLLAEQASDEERAPILRRALELWRGEALAGLSSGWLSTIRGTLERQRLDAVLELNDIAIRRGQHGVLVSELPGLAAAHPTDERLAGQLMLVLYRSGRQAEALQAFEQTRRQLAEDLGADPGPDLQSLHQRILRSDAGLAPQQHYSLYASPVPRLLPAEVSAFTGRTEELAELDRLLAVPAAGPGATEASHPVARDRRPGTSSLPVPVAVLSGTAGVGKTALAVRWAHRAAEHFPDGQLYVNLRGYDDVQPVQAGDALAGFLRVLGMAPGDVPAGLDERAARYRSMLAGRRVLVVLDNAVDADQVRSLLPGTPGCSALVTSRDMLAGLVARDGALRLDLDLLPEGDAVSLLQKLIGTRVAADPQAATTLAAQCARLPLALRVAAELVVARHSVPLADLVAELADQHTRLRLLESSGDRHAAVRTVFSWSYRQLDAESARTFRMLGLHAGPDLDVYAAAAITGSTISSAREKLDRLKRANLVQSSRRGRHDMHDLLRGYARELCAAADAEDQQRAALARLCDHYLCAAGMAMGALFPAEQSRRPAATPPASTLPPVETPAAARAWLDAERANLVAAVVQMSDGEQPGAAISLAATLFRYLDVGGYFPEALIVHGQARRAASLSGDGAAEAEALANLASVHMRQGHHPQAASQYEQALGIYRAAGDRPGEARALNNLAITDIEQGKYRQAAERLEQSLAIYRAASDRLGEARALVNLGVIDLKHDCYEEATGRLREAVAVFSEIDDHLGQAGALILLGLADLRRQHPARALGLLRQALTIYREIGDRTGEADALVTIADAELRLGHRTRAASSVRESLDICRQLGSSSAESRALNVLGEILRASGRGADARAAHLAAVSLSGQTGDREEEARARSGLASCYDAAGDLSRAREHWEHALTIYADLGAPEAEEIRARLAAAEAGARQVAR
jgi:DNA-binding SARP family transcriptional activator/tetratricopeptide (TPR) repeat protein